MIIDPEAVRAEPAATRDHTAIEVVDLVKTYDRTPAVRGLDLHVARGEVFGLLGLNGAGKTTTVEILEGFRTATSGHVRVLGFDPAANDREFRERVGVVPQEGGLPGELTVAEVIDMFRRYYRNPPACDELLATVALEPERDQRVRTLSGGQRRRVELAVALAGNPELVFLDEPTTGFDPGARRRMWARLRQLADEGTTVVLTTHYMEEAEAVADRVALIVAGRIVAEGAPATLAPLAGATSTIRFVLPDGVGVDDLPAIGDLVEVAPGGVTYETTEADRALARLLDWAGQSDLRIDGLRVQPPSLEAIYLRLTGG